MDIGRGVHLTVGRGLATNRGDGLRITTAAGSTTTTTGHGCRAVISTEDEVGGDQRWLRLYLISHSVTTSAGIRCRTTTEIHTRVITVTTIAVQVTAVVVAVVVAEVTVAAVEVVAAETIVTTTITARRGVVSHAFREENSIIQVGEVAALTTNALHVESSTPHRETRNCRAAKDSRVMYPEAPVKQRPAGPLAGIRLSISRNVRLVLLKDLPVWHWMKIFVVREFFEDEIRGRLIQDERNRQKQARLPRLKLDPRV